MNLLYKYELIKMIHHLFLLSKISSLSLINKNNLCYKNFTSY